MEQVIIILDASIALISLWVLKELIGFGGTIGKAFNLIGAGISIIGLSQIIETVGINFTSLDVTLVEMSHRFFVLLGILILTMGFQTLLEKD